MNKSTQGKGVHPTIMSIAHHEATHTHTLARHCSCRDTCQSQATAWWWPLQLPCRQYFQVWHTRHHSTSV